MTRPVLVLVLVAAAGAGGLLLGASLRPEGETVIGPPGGGEMSVADGERVEIIFFDVGAGDSAAILTPGEDRKVLLIDGGSPTAARTHVLPILRARGVRVLDLVVLTHPDPDHLDGLAPILLEMSAREVWDPGVKVRGQDFQRFVTLARQYAGDRYYAPFEACIVADPAEDTDDDAARRIVLGRPERFGPLEVIPLHTNDLVDSPHEIRDRNDASIVLRVVMGENSVLFTGDVSGRRKGKGAGPGEPRYSEAALLELERSRPGLLRSTVLKIPHHGRPTSSSQAFLDAVAPRWAVLSAGGMSSAETMLRYMERRITVLRTDAGDGNRPKAGDDHVILRMGRRAGDLRWRRADTATLVSERR